MYYHQMHTCIHADTYILTQSADIRTYTYTLYIHTYIRSGMVLRSFNLNFSTTFYAYILTYTRHFGCSKFSNRFTQNIWEHLNAYTHTYTRSGMVLRSFNLNFSTTFYAHILTYAHTYVQAWFCAHFT